MYLIKHRGAKPAIHETASIAATAVVSGDVTIGEDTVVLAGAVITSEGAPVSIGARCVVMENAVIRGAGRHPCTIGHHVLIGPHGHVCGATIAPRCFLSTGATVFNGSVLEEGTRMAVHSVVHIDTFCPASTFIPAGHTAFGEPARIFRPDEALSLHRLVAAKGFTRTVFGFDSTEMGIPDSVELLCDRYAGALHKHAVDRLEEED